MIQLASILLPILLLLANTDWMQAASESQVRSFIGHTSGVKSVVISSDGKYLLSGAWDGTMRVWDIASGGEIHCIRDYQRGIIGSVDFSPDARVAASVDANELVRLHDVASGKEIRHFKAYSSHADHIAVTPDGKHIVTSGGDSHWKDVDCLVKLWDFKTGKMIRIFKGHDSFVECIAVSRDAKFLLTGAGHWDGDRKPIDCTARIWELSTGKELRRFVGHTYMIKAVNISPDGKYVVSGGGDKTIRLWDVATGKEIRQFEGQTESVWSVAFSPDGKSVIAGVGGTREVIVPVVGKIPIQYERTSIHTDCTVRIWETATARQTHCFTGHEGPVMTVSFTPDGKSVVSGSDDRTIRLWPLVPATK